MPEPPYRYLSLEAPVLDLSDIAERVATSEARRQEAYVRSRSIQRGLLAARADLGRTDDGEEDASSRRIASLRSALAEAVRAVGVGDGDDYDPADRTPRIGNLGRGVEDLCRLMSMSRFLTSGDLLPPSACSNPDLAATDEEYLAGACMGTAQDLSRYAMGRATARDVRSVRQARDLVSAILDYLLKFDFRNGYLRRKYDGVKYALKVGRKKMQFRHHVAIFEKNPRGETRHT